jgi:hypothetical protein
LWPVYVRYYQNRKLGTVSQHLLPVQGIIIDDDSVVWRIEVVGAIMNTETMDARKLYWLSGCLAGIGGAMLTISALGLLLL